MYVLGLFILCILSIMSQTTSQSIPRQTINQQEIMKEFSFINSITMFIPIKPNDKALFEITIIGNNITEQYDELYNTLENNVEIRIVRNKYIVAQKDDILMSMFKQAFDIIKIDRFYTIYPSIEFVENNIVLLRINQMNENVKNNNKIMRVDVVTYINFLTRGI